VTKGLFDAILTKYIVYPSLREHKQIKTVHPVKKVFTSIDQEKTMSIDDWQARSSHYTEFHHPEVEPAPYAKYGIVLFVAFSFVVLIGVMFHIMAVERAENQQRKEV